MTEQLISIVTPTYNSAEHIEACILNVAKQTYSNKEHLFIDNLSADGTQEIVRKYACIYPHIRLISEKDKGIYDAMNKGIDLSSGNWLYFMGCDDAFVDNNVLTSIFASDKPENKDVIYGNVIWGKGGPLYDGQFTPLKLLNKNICHQAIFFNRTLFDKLGLFEIKYIINADWEFNMRWFLRNDIRIHYTEQAIAVYNLRGYSSTINDLVFMENKQSLIHKYFPEEYALIFDWHIKNNKNKSLINEQGTLYTYINALQSHIDILDGTINKLRSPIYWKMTKPIRKLLKLIKKQTDYISTNYLNKTSIS